MSKYTDEQMSYECPGRFRSVETPRKDREREKKREDEDRYMNDVKSYAQVLDEVLADLRYV